MTDDALRIWAHLPAHRRRQFGWLVAMAVLAAGTEALSVGSLVPFLVVLSNPDQLLQYSSGRAIARILQIEHASELQLPITLLFCGIVLGSAAIRLTTLWLGNRVTFAAGTDLADLVFQRALFRPYAVHNTRSSSELIDLLTTGVNTFVFDVLLPTVTIISGACLVAALIVTLLLIDPVVALSSFLGISLIYALVALQTRHRLTRLSQVEADNVRRRIKTIQESFGGMRDVVLHASQGVYRAAFHQANVKMNQSVASKRFIGQAPRFVVEALAMALVAILALVLTAGADGLEGIVPVLGAFALGAQRLLPTAQGMFSSWSTIKGATSYLSKVRGFLDETSESAEGVPAKPGPALQFERTIMLEQVRYTYPGAERPALLDLTLSVPAGSRIGVVGPSGSGKSTLIDLLMGLLEPEAGRLVVDDIVIDSSNRAAWQRNIAHVPQHPFLSDASIAENIAFGVPSGQIDIERVMDAASKAHIAEFIESQPDGYGTVVGERGVKLSGGQRQRLAIARALYRQARVLVFDEATSALDHDTEAAVMASIQELSTELTIIMIAHRLSTLRGCDRIIVMTAGRVERVGPYAEVVA